MPYLSTNIVEELKTVSLFEENKGYLSFDGIVLVIFNFGNPPTYYLPNFQILKDVAKKLKKLLRNFLLEVDGNLFIL